jgi:hypothetical protein
MDFPDFGAQDNDNNFNNNQNDNNNDIVINEEHDFNNNPFGGQNNQNFGEPMDNNNIMDTGNTYNNMDWGVTSMDPEEEKRLAARQEEDTERRKKLNEKISKELQDKQDLRKEALEHLQRWEAQRSNNISKKKEFNKGNESEYLKQREGENSGKVNPWDKVIQNIQLKEGEHKGQRDITRMKAVILQRKNDFVNMKMK